MKKLVYTFIALMTLSSAMGQDKTKPVKSIKVKKPVTITTKSGLQYTITEKGDGKKPEQGDNVVVHYTGKLTNDTVFDSSKPRGTPFTFKLGKGMVIKGWDEAFALLQVGDKATIRIPPDLGYGPQAMGKIPANATLIFDIELLDVKEGVKPWKITSKDTITTESGLKCIIIQANDKGQQATVGSSIKVHYTGFFPDGKVFDSSVDRGQPFVFNVGTGQVIKGWDEGFSKLRTGEKARLIIPYQLAYGENGRPGIPAKATLIFDVEFLEIVQ